MSSAAWRFRSPPRERGNPKTPPPARGPGRPFLRFNDPAADNSFLEIESDLSSSDHELEQNSSAAVGGRERKRAKLEAKDPKIGLLQDTIEDFSSQEPFSQNEAQLDDNEQTGDTEHQSSSPLDATPFLPPLRRWRGESAQTPARRQPPPSSSVPPSTASHTRATQFLPPPLFSRANAFLPETPASVNRQQTRSENDTPTQQRSTSRDDGNPPTPAGGFKQLKDHFKAFVPPSDLDHQRPQAEERLVAGGGIPTSPAGKFVSGGLAHLVSSLILEMSSTTAMPIASSSGGLGSPVRKKRHSRSVSQLRSPEAGNRADPLLASGSKDEGRRRIDHTTLLVETVVSSSLPERYISNYGQNMDGIVTLVDGVISSDRAGPSGQKRRVLLCGLPEGKFEIPVSGSSIAIRRPWWTVNVAPPGSEPDSLEREEWLVVVRWNVHVSEA